MHITNAYGLPTGNSDTPLTITHPRQGIPHVIHTPEQLANAAQALHAGTTPIAADVERAHGYRYSTRPYLIQIRRENIATYLIDPIALPDLSGLLPQDSTPWILHDSSQDLNNLRYVHLRPTNLFDTMIAARLIGLPRVGLAAVAQQLLGLSLAKEHQTNDWSVRPLYPDWLRYAALDVELLTEIYRKESLRLDALNRMEWAEQEFAAALNAPAPLPSAEPWRKGTGAGKIRQRRHLGLFKDLWYLREGLAKELDIAPTHLVSNADLITAAQMMPRNRRSLLSIDGFRSPVARQFTTRWLEAVYQSRFCRESDLPDLQGHLAPGELPALPRWKQQHPDALGRLQVVRQVVARVSEVLAVEPDVVLLPKAQRHLAWLPLVGTQPLGEIESRLHSAGARPWQIELCAVPLCDALMA